MKPFTVKINFSKPKRSSDRLQKKQTQAAKTSSSKDPTGALRQKRFRDNRKDDATFKQKNKEKCTRYRDEVAKKREANSEFDSECKEKERLRKAEYRKKKKEEQLAMEANSVESHEDLMEEDPVQEEIADSGEEQTSTTDETITALRKQVKVLQQFKRRSIAKSSSSGPKKSAAIRKRAQRVRKQLPESPGKWAETVAHIVRNASPRKRMRLLKTDKGSGMHRKLSAAKSKEKGEWQDRVREYVCSDELSRQMPNKRDVIKVDGVSTAKKHLLCTKRQAFAQFVEKFPTYPYKYTTFCKSIPKFIKKMNMNDRRVCVCMKCFNISEKIRPLSRIAVKCGHPAMTLRSLYKESVCSDYERFPKLPCVESKCPQCKDVLSQKKTTLVLQNQSTQVLYTQWEQINSKYTNSKGELIERKAWKQVDHKEDFPTVYNRVCEEMKDIKGHLFRNDFQYYQHQQLIQNLPLDHAVAYGDFSQNYLLAPNDEIEAAHYATPQVTIHPWYLLRHAVDSTLELPKIKKEAIVIVSNYLKHDVNSVYNFTLKLLAHMEKYPEKVALPAVVHRITDNCGFEYKCKKAFGHLYSLEDTMGVKFIYHYSEPGHGKGPHDGIGATVKHGLDRLVLHDRARLRHAYEVYLTAVQHLSNESRKILYVPLQAAKNAPQVDVQPVKGTLQLRSIQTVSAHEVKISNLSCTCSECLAGRDECLFKNWHEFSTVSIRKIPPASEIGSQPCCILAQIISQQIYFKAGLNLYFNIFVLGHKYASCNLL